ncbi:MAG: CRTAC1 family protein [Pirellulaceae bacterium]
MTANAIRCPLWILAMAVGLLTLGIPRSSAGQCPIQLHEVSGETGITFRHTDGSSGRRYIMETVSAGLALFDYDGDGWIDIYFVNGAPLQGTQTTETPRNALYRNEGGWKFRDVTDQAGVGDTGFGLGVTIADYDQDGYPDIYISNFGPNVLYHNQGDGTFSVATATAGVAAGNTVGAGVAFLDIDADGDLDLYAANYVKFTYETNVERTIDGFPEYAGPKSYPHEPDHLFRNNSDGTFSDISREAGIAELASSGMGMVCADYDRDGDTDIFVLNDVAGNFLLRNDGAGKFENVAVEAGFAYNLNGHELGAMGLDCGDYDNDGWLDFFMTSYSGELPVLFRNLGDGYFEDVTLLSGAGAGSLPHVNWGTGFVDFDNDGDLDLFIAQGHLQDNLELYSDTYTYKARNTLLMNNGPGSFTDVSKQAGDGLLPKQSSRGAAFDDLDNDGDVDAVIVNSREPSTILRNDSHTGHHWIQIELRGVLGNRDGVGAQVTVVAGDLSQVQEVHSGRSYQSHFGSRLSFGLGPRDRVDRMEVRWLGGATQVFRDVSSDQRWLILEGADRPIPLGSAVPEGSIDG